MAQAATEASHDEVIPSELDRRREVIVREGELDGRREVVVREAAGDEVIPWGRGRTFIEERRRAEDVHTQLRDIRSFQERAQERNEEYFRTLLCRQSSLESAIGSIYRRGIQEQGETLLKILVAVEQMRVEQGETARTVEALRLWAKLMQETGLPADVSLRGAVAALGQTVESLGGINQYVELSLPLVPGICYYKVELGSEHQGALTALHFYLWEMWKEIKSWVAE